MPCVGSVVKGTPSPSRGDFTVTAGDASFDFWAIVDGRALPPSSARLVNWRFIGLDEGGVLACAFEATELFLNPAGFVQGGILATMLDEVMSPVVAAVSRERVFTQTLEMKISYLRGTRPGTIFGEGRMLHRGQSIVFLEGRLLDSERKLIAVATATARVVLAPA
jgi:uncharacterized protein (TIGR00369 family)